MVVAVVVLVETVAHHRLLQVYDLVLGLTGFAGCANLSVVRNSGKVKLALCPGYHCGVYWRFVDWWRSWWG